MWLCDVLSERGVYRILKTDILQETAALSGATMKKHDVPEALFASLLADYRET